MEDFLPKQRYFGPRTCIRELDVESLVPSDLLYEVEWHSHHFELFLDILVFPHPLVSGDFEVPLEELGSPLGDISCNSNNLPEIKHIVSVFLTSSQSLDEDGDHKKSYFINSSKEMSYF